MPAAAHNLWLEVDERGSILRRSEDVAALFAAASPGMHDLARLLERRTDVRAAIGRRAGHVRFGIGRGADRVTFDVEIDPGVQGARLRLTEVAALGDDVDVGRLLLAHTELHPDAAIVSDADGVILWCDRSFAWLVRYEREEIVGSHAEIYTSPRVGRREMDGYWRSLYATGVFSGRTLLRRSDGADVPVHQAATAVRDAAGRTTHYVAVLRDLTRERELERLRSLDAAVNLLSRVSGDQAHRLNNLAAEIVAVCDRAMLSDDPASAGAALERVLAAGAQLGALGRQMLALSTSGSGRGPADMGRVARDLAEILRLAAADDGPDVEVRVEGEGPWVACSPDGLVRACIHLALRSLDGVAPGSSVTITAATDYDDGVLCIRYVPTPSERAALQWLLPDGAVTGPMVNELLGRAYGAGVVLELQEDRGGSVAICVRAPLSEVAVSAPPPVRPTPAREPRAVLVADDNTSLRELMSVSLGAVFPEVVQASDGQEVLRLLDERGGDLDLLVLDLRMPVRTGLEVLQEAHRRWPDLPILVVTGAAPDGLARSALAAGARAVLPKPFRLHELRALARSVVAGAEW